MMTYLTVAWAFALAHKMAILTALATLSTALVNRHVGGAGFQQFLQLVLDLLSPVTQKGAMARVVGTNATIASPIKLPLLMRSHRVQVLGAVTPVPTMTAKYTAVGYFAIAALVLGVFLAAGCCKNPDSTGCKVATGLEACAAPAVQSEVTGLLPTVTAILTGGAVDATAQLVALEVKIGVQYVICAVEAAVEALSNKLPSASMLAAADPKLLAPIKSGISLGVNYLEGHHVTVPAYVKLRLATVDGGVK